MAASASICGSSKRDWTSSSARAGRCRSIATRSSPTSRRPSSRSARGAQRGELFERRALLLGRMPFVVALDQRLDDADLELGGGCGKRALDLIEREHDLEAVLELRLGNLGVALELVAHARVEAARIARREIGGSPGLGAGARLDYVREALEAVGEARQPVGRGPVRFGPGHGGARRR